MNNVKTLSLFLIMPLLLVSCGDGGGGNSSGSTPSISSTLKWTKTFGGTGWDGGTSVQQTSDGGYIVAANTGLAIWGTNDVYLIKTDASGNKTWEKTFGGMNEDLGYSVQQTSDDGYVIVGSTESFGQGSSDVYVIKVDVAGKETWYKTFGGAGWDYGRSVQQTSDGGYIIVGSTSSFGMGSTDIYLIKTDVTGSEEWHKTFGGAGTQYGTSVQQTSDSGYIIAGTEVFDALTKRVYLVRRIRPAMRCGTIHSASLMPAIQCSKLRMVDIY
jgi:hypothetical protein